MENIKLEQYFDDLERYAEDIRDSVEKIIDNISDIREDIFLHHESIALDKNGNMKVDTTEIHTSIHHLELMVQKVKNELNKIS